MAPTEYRPCVVAVFTNGAGQVLTGERSDAPGSWQLPQGGIDPGESALNALYREMREELGCDQFKVIKEAKGIVKYKFPSGLQAPVAKKWIGQSQTWFLVKLDDGASWDLMKSDGEFRAIAWMDPRKLLDGTIAWKREAYHEGLLKLGVLKS